MLKTVDFEKLADPAINQFRFTCPIFNSEVHAADCFTLREMHWKGQRQEDRNGCHACLASSKCPVPHMLKELDTGKELYLSEKAILGSISAEVRERIDAVIVMESTLDQFSVIGDERAAILEASDNSKAATTKSVARTRTRSSVRRIDRRTSTQEPEEHASAPDLVQQATAGNDMAAAITAAVAAEAEKSIQAAGESKVVPEKPMSVLDIAKRMRQAQ